MFGIVGCVLCLVGSISIVLHAPLERKIESVMDVWHLASEAGISKKQYQLHSFIFSESSYYRPQLA